MRLALFFVVRGRRPLFAPGAVVGAIGVILGCASGGPAHEGAEALVRAASRRPAARGVAGQAKGEVRALGRRALAPVEDMPLPFELEPVAGGSLLAVASSAGDRVAWARRIDGATGLMGPLLRFVDERVVAMFERGEAVSVVTSDGKRLCIGKYAAGAGEPGPRGCAEVAPVVVTPLGDRLALIELAVDAGHPRVDVNVGVRWASFEGTIDGSVSPTGLHFERPMAGMMLVDAVPRAGGVDLVFYETASGRTTKAKLGSARFGAATLREDGTLDSASRRAFLAGDLEYGGISGRRAPRLLATDAGTVLVTNRARGGPCDAMRLFPSVGQPASAPVACAIDPYGLASRDPSAARAGEDAALARIFELEPRRAPWQPRDDGPLVAWVGERGYFAPAGALDAGVGLLFSADRSGEVRAEPSPFPAKRSRVAWGAFARDGDGIAMASGRLYRLDAAGGVSPVEASSGALGAPTAPEGGAHVARIGATWWRAQRDVVRLVPPGASRELAGRANPDATALVGGHERGLFLELASGALRVGSLGVDGEVAWYAATASPVRTGFAGVERATGGAIVAGPSAHDPAVTVAFVVAPDGRLSAAERTSLALPPGQGAVRLVAFPSGGALLTDQGRSRVVWLDESARELAAAPWPAEDDGRPCLDGVPARVAVPTPEPGVFARVPELSGECVVGDVAWAADGTLRWFGTVSRGLDAIAEASVVDVAGVGTSAPKALRDPPLDLAAAASPPPAAAPCPSEMVSIAGHFCVDRYEATLVDAATREPLSPDYPATPHFLEVALADWSTGRKRWSDVHARALALPLLPVWEAGASFSPVAVSRAGARPNGYVTGLVAEAACASAGKRLCTLAEFRTACRGEDDTQFPYGSQYVEGACNVDRDDHPAFILHGNASLGHLDPRLDRVSGAGGPLLHLTGATGGCASRWGTDAVYDMVGNLDEWVTRPARGAGETPDPKNATDDDPGGAFAGGFYSRGTRAGCNALITTHPRVYLDYSTGVRCCKDAAR